MEYSSVIERDVMWRVRVCVDGQGVDLLEYVFGLSKYTEKDASWLMSQLFAGLQYLHSLNIVHRNVKLSNILVCLLCALSVCLSVCLSVSLSLSVCLSVCLSVSVLLSVCLSVCSYRSVLVGSWVVARRRHSLVCLWAYDSRQVAYVFMQTCAVHLAVYCAGRKHRLYRIQLNILCNTEYLIQWVWQKHCTTVYCPCRK